MSYIDDLEQAAQEALDASASATESAQKMYDVANGSETDQVTTDGGSVDTLAKAIKDLKDSFADGILSSEIETQTLSEDQTTVTLTELTLNSRPLMFIEGSFEEDFTVVSETEIELGQSFPDGTNVWFLQNVSIGDAETQFVQTLGVAMEIDPTVLGAKTLGTDSDATVKLTIDGTDYYLPAYTTAP